jgi:deoxyribose-phosphate aldolase
MNIQKILKSTDHTQLSQTCTAEDIHKLCEEAVKYNTASVCIPPYYVKAASDYLEDKIPVCTVIGFPNGYTTTRTKIFEAYNVLENGADEIDMVISLCALKNGSFNYVRDEIAMIKKVCEDKVLKVIIEAGLINEPEKIMMCGIVTEAGADYIKTSTGFAGSGAKLEDIRLFKEHIGPDVKIKAAGGIQSLEEAQAFLDAGASRLGSSRIVDLAMR